MTQSVMNIQTAYATALLVDDERLGVESGPVAAFHAGHAERPFHGRGTTSVDGSDERR